MTITASTSTSGESVLQLDGQSASVSIPIKFGPSVIVASPRFVSWINSYLPRPQQRLKLQEITFEIVDICEDDSIGFIRLHASVVRTPEDIQVGGVVMLNGPSVAVLVVFRVNPEGSAPGSENTPVYRPSDPQATAAPPGLRPREHVLLVKQPRPAVGAPEHRELPSGQISLDGSFTGVAFTSIYEACGLKIYESQVEDLTSLALSVKRIPSRSLGVSLSPASMDERVRLFLYRESVSQQFIDSFQKPRTNPGNSGTVDLWTLNDAWRVTSDARTLSALFLFHELRYHQVMPRYRQPREIKKVAQFTSVADLNPNQTGINLKVKVAHPLKLVPHPTRSSIQRGMVVVGDHTGVVTLSLDESQKSLVPGFTKQDSPLYLRNVEFDMSDGHITIVLDSFGKVSVPSDEELEQFMFNINVNNDVSATEYEKVFQSESAATNYPTIRGGRGRGRPRGTRGGRTWNISS